MGLLTVKTAKTPAYVAGLKEMILRAKALVILTILLFHLSPLALADQTGIVSRVTSAPVFPNGILRDGRSGLNIHLQTDAVKGLDFMDPAVEGYGIPPGGSLEVELMGGFQRDTNVALDQRSILLTVGAPQQGLPLDDTLYTVQEGQNSNTFIIRPAGAIGLNPSTAFSTAPGSKNDPVRARGIKIIHIGRQFAFVARGKEGKVKVRFLDRSGSVLASGSGSVTFLKSAQPAIFPTNVTHDQRNHDWQEVPVGGVVGRDNGTLPIPYLVYEKNEGLGREGMLAVGVLSSFQLESGGYIKPQALSRFTYGLILQDTTGDGFLDPNTDRIVGGITMETPKGGESAQMLTPLVDGRMFLSKPTGLFNRRAGATIGGAVMQVVMSAGPVPGKYRATLTFLREAGNLESGDGHSVTTTVIAQ